MSTNKLYILNIRMKNQFKRLYFEGPDSQEVDQKFSTLQNDIQDIGENSGGWIKFVGNVIEHFQNNGFIRIQG